MQNDAPPTAIRVLIIGVDLQQPTTVEVKSSVMRFARFESEFSALQRSSIYVHIYRVSAQLFYSFGC